MIGNRRFLTVLISLFLVGISIWSIGTVNLFERIASVPGWVLGSMLVLLALNLMIVVVRFARILSHFGFSVPFPVAAQASIFGYVAGLVVISLFGQVAGRQVVMHNAAVSPIANAAIAAYERIVLALVTGAAGVIGAAYLLGKEELSEFLVRLPIAEIMLVASAAGLLSYLVGRSKFEDRLSAKVFTWLNVKRLSEVIAWTVIGQSLILGCFLVPILVMAPEIETNAAVAAAAVISFAASLPISVNGWGVREVAAVYVLGRLGVQSSDALAVSILVGAMATVTVLAALPLVANSQKSIANTDYGYFEISRKSNIEDSAAWMFGMATAVLVFFQFHAVLPAGTLNFNLADPIAILALAALLLHSFATRTWPAWRFTKVNAVLLAISGVLLFGFFRGYLSIGITQWALVGRMLGWLLLMGYMAAGYLIVAYAGYHGMRRIAETMISTMVVIVLVTVIVRIFWGFGISLGGSVSLNFDGYAGNRNAFAFQLLTVFVLLSAYISLFCRGKSSGDGLKLSSLSLAIVLAGIVWTASRTGLIVAVILLCTFWCFSPRERKLLTYVLPMTFVIWSVPVLVVHVLGGAGVQSVLSNEGSNTERLETIIYAMRLWQDSPFFGSGLGVFFARSPEWFGHPLVIHSTPFWLLAEFGLIGLAVVGCSWLLLAHAAWKSRCRLPYSRALLMLLVLFGVFCLAHEMFYQRVLWFVAGVLLASPYCYRMEIRDSLRI